MNLKKIIIILFHAFIGWALCAITMGIGIAVTSLQNALIIHAIGVPIYFAGVSLIYFRKFKYTTPLQTAIIFTGFVIAVDFFIVALLINKSFEMFTSLLGTWIPFVLIFTSTYLTGLYLRIEYVSAKEMKKMRGFLKGIDTTVKRDRDRI